MRFLLLALTLACCAGETMAAALREKVGGSEVRVWSEPYPLHAGRTVFQAALLERLERAASNRPGHGTGRDLYLRQVRTRSGAAD